MARPAKQGRPGALRAPEKAAEAEHLLAQGHSQRQVAEALGVGNGTVARFSQERQDRIEALRQQIQETASEKVLEHIEAAMEAQMLAASDPEKRHGPQALRAATEAAGITGKGVEVHIGDNVTNVVDLSQHVHLGRDAKQDAARARELLDELM